MPTFAVSYPPVSGESFLGYLVRILYINGYYELRSVSQIFNCKVYKSSYIPGTKEFDELATLLAPSLKLEIDMLMNHFKPYQRTYQESRNIQDVFVYTPKFCPFCIKEKPYFQDSWQMLNVTHCETHHVMLIDQCPHCTSTFVDWNGFLFQGCPQCGNKWHGFQFPTIQLPSYQLATLGPEQVDAIFDTLLFILRPNDLMFRSLQGIELSIVDTVKRLEIAYELLTHPELRHEWSNRVALSNKYQLKPSFHGLSVEEIFEQNSHKFQQHHVSIASHFEMMIPPVESHLTHRRNKFAAKGIPYHRHLGIREVAFILGITTNDVMPLIASQLIKPLDSQAMLRDQIFDLDNVTSLLDEINEHAQLVEYGNGFMKVKDFLPMLQFFGLSAGMFLSVLSLFTGHYYRISTKQHWLDLLINYDDMLRALEDRYLNLLTDLVDKKDFQSIFGLSDEQMNNVMKNSDLHYSNWQRMRQCIKKNVIIDFCSKFIILNRIAKLKRKNVHVFAKELTEIGIFPVQVLKGTRDVFLYSINDKDDVFSKN